MNLTTIGIYLWNGIQRTVVPVTPLELYNSYWINGSFFGKYFQDIDWIGDSLVIYEEHTWKPLLENITLQAKCMYLGEFNVSYGLFWSGHSNNVFQYLFLDEKLNPVYFLLWDYYLHGS